MFRYGNTAYTNIAYVYNVFKTRSIVVVLYILFLTREPVDPKIKRRVHCTVTVHGKETQLCGESNQS